MVGSVGFVVALVRFFGQAVPETAPAARQNTNVNIDAMKNNVRALHKLKILVSWGQVASTVDTTFGVPWPASFRRLLQGMGSVFNLDVFGFVSGFGCLFDASFAVNFATHMLTLPLVLGLLGLAAWSVA